jgi:hypothetical protein
MTVTFVYFGRASQSTRLEICACILQSILAKVAKGVLLIKHVDRYVVLDRCYH